MKFPCPHCGLSQQVDIARVKDKTFRQICRGCDMRITVKEVSTTKHYAQGQTVFCSSCGSKFSSAKECPSCKADFSAYLLVFTEKLQPAGKSPSSAKTVPVKRNELEPGNSIINRFRIISVRLKAAMGVLAVVLSIAIGAEIINHYRSAEQTFLTNYVMALYGIKSGFDRGASISNEYMTAWQQAASLGASTPETDSEELFDLETVKQEVVKLMRTLDAPPETLRDAVTKLGQLNAVYERQNSLAQEPHGSLAVYEQNLLKNQSDFQRTLEDLKAALPPLLREEIKKTGIRYNLRFMEQS